jgi:hypothetical protein
VGGSDLPRQHLRHRPQRAPAASRRREVGLTVADVMNKMAPGMVGRPVAAAQVERAYNVVNR